MKAGIIDTSGKSSGSIDLPVQFSEAYRPDLIKRAVLSVQSRQYQAKGTDPRAGMKNCVEVSKRRRKYKGVYGHGWSRTPKKTMQRRGLRFGFVGAEAPHAVGGRRAFPPKPEKVLELKLNKKEKNKALRSAVSATVIPGIISKRGHLIEGVKLPLVLNDDFQKIKQTSKVINSLIKLGLSQELERVSEKKIRPGRGKTRGRKYKRKIGPLLIVNDDCELLRSAGNIAGVEVVKINSLNAEMLAPGAKPGRLTLFTRSAVKKLEDEKLWMNSK